MKKRVNYNIYIDPNIIIAKKTIGLILGAYVPTNIRQNNSTQTQNPKIVYGFLKNTVLHKTGAPVNEKCQNFEIIL